MTKFFSAILRKSCRSERSIEEMSLRGALSASLSGAIMLSRLTVDNYWNVRLRETFQLSSRRGAPQREHFVHGRLRTPNWVSWLRRRHRQRPATASYSFVSAEATLARRQPPFWCRRLSSDIVHLVDSVNVSVNVSVSICTAHHQRTKCAGCAIVPKMLVLNKFCNLSH